MKSSVDIAKLSPLGLGFYGALCGWALSRTHARTGDAVAVSSDLGRSDTLDGAIADFAEAYADVNDRDDEAFKAAVASGGVPASDSGPV